VEPTREDENTIAQGSGQAMPVALPGWNDMLAAHDIAGVPPDEFNLHLRHPADP